MPKWLNGFCRCIGQTHLGKMPLSKILEKYNYHSVHTINNAALVIAAFLWGEKDYSKTVVYAVLSGLDTDCSGATAGSLIGVMIGAAGIPFEWVSPLNDLLNTAISGLGRVRISELANRTLKAMRLHQGRVQRCG